MCGGDNQTTQQTEYEANPWVKRGAKKAIREAMHLSNKGYTTPTRQIEGFTPDQELAFDAVRDNYNYWQPAFAKAGDYVDQSAATIGRGDVDNYLNPWASYALAGLNEDIGVQNRDLSGRLAQTTGGVGADRIAVGMAEKSRTDQLARGQLMSGFYDRALQAAQQEKQRQAAAGASWMNIGAGGQGAALQGAQALYGSGLAQQGLGQARLDADYAATIANLEAPWKFNQQLTQTVGALAPALGGTTTQTNTYPETSPWGTIAGLGMSAAGMAMGAPTMGMGSFGKSGAGMGVPTYGAPSRLYERGGAVTPFDFAEGFDMGGAPEWSMGMPGWANDQLGHDLGLNNGPDWQGQPPLWGGVPVSVADGPPQWPGATLPPAPVAMAQATPQQPGPYDIIPDPLAPKVPTGAPVTDTMTDALPAGARPTSGPVFGQPPGVEVGFRPPTPAPDAMSLDQFMPRQPRRGTLGDRLVEAGFTTMAHANDRDSRGLPLGPFAAIGKGGQAAIKGGREELGIDQKTIAAEQKAKELLDDAQRWRANLSENSRYHDLVASNRASETARKFEADQKKGVRGNWIGTNAKDDDGNDIIRWYNKHNPSETKVTYGKLTGPETSLERRIDSVKREYGVDTEQALRIMKRPGTSDPDILRREAEAARRAGTESRDAATLGRRVNYDDLLEKHRKQLGLPPASAVEE